MILKKIKLEKWKHKLIGKLLLNLLNLHKLLLEQKQDYNNLKLWFQHYKDKFKNNKFKKGDVVVGDALSKEKAIEIVKHCVNDYIDITTDKRKLEGDDKKLIETLIRPIKNLFGGNRRKRSRKNKYKKATKKVVKGGAKKSKKCGNGKKK